MKQTLMKVSALCAIAVLFCVVLSACGTSQSSSESSEEESNIPAPVEVSADNPLWGFWDGSDYADPTDLAKDNSFVDRYAGMKGVSDVRFFNPVYYAADKEIEINYSPSIASFEWEGISYMPALLQAELKMNDGTIVEEEGFVIPGANCSRFTCSDNPAGEKVAIRLRAVVGPYDGEARAYSEWTEWYEMEVKDSSEFANKYSDVSNGDDVDIEEEVRRAEE